MLSLTAYTVFFLIKDGRKKRLKKSYPTGDNCGSVLGKDLGLRKWVNSTMTLMLTQLLDESIFLLCRLGRILHEKTLTWSAMIQLYAFDERNQNTIHYIYMRIMNISNISILFYKILKMRAR